MSTQLNTDPVQAGALVRYIEPSTRRFRIGRVDRVVTRGEHKGQVVVRSVASDAKRSIVSPEKIKILVESS